MKHVRKRQNFSIKAWRYTEQNSRPLNCPHKLCYATLHYGRVREVADHHGVTVRQDARI
jgi:hypothetical protein